MSAYCKRTWWDADGFCKIWYFLESNNGEQRGLNPEHAIAISSDDGLRLLVANKDAYVLSDDEISHDCKLWKSGNWIAYPQAKKVILYGYDHDPGFDSYDPYVHF